VWFDRRHQCFGGTVVSIIRVEEDVIEAEENSM
jgi:hypothetical protein